MNKSLAKHVESLERESDRELLEDPIVSEHSFNYPHPFQVPHKNDQSKISPGNNIISGNLYQSQ